MKKNKKIIKHLSKQPIITFLFGFLILFLGRSLSFSYNWISILFYCLSGLAFLSSVGLFYVIKENRNEYPEKLQKALWLFWGVGFLTLFFYLLQIEPVWNLIAQAFENKTIPEWLNSLKKFFQFAYLALVLIVFNYRYFISIKF